VNGLVPSRYSESFGRLAVGVEPLDAATHGRVAVRLAVSVRDRPVRSLHRHSSCRYVLMYDRDFRTPVEVLLADPSRRYVPRRLSFAAHELADVLAAEAADVDIPARERVWRPALFPGAAYPVSPRATGLRGRIRRDGKPVRWARVEATIGGDTIGRAHGDDRGEFLLVLGRHPNPLSSLAANLTVRLAVTAPAPVLAVDTSDPLADLPVEPAAAPADPDPVSAGDEVAGTYATGTTTAFPNVSLPLGRVTSGRPPFEL
jgi:hypothetical protein